MMELGLGAREVFSVGGRGAVAAVFAKAAYLRLPGGLVALTTMGAPAGPLHARGPMSFAGVAADDPVTVEGSTVRAGGVALDFAGARLWRGRLPASAAMEAGAGVALGVLDGAPASALADFGPQVDRAVAHLDRDDLHGVVGALAGLGPGLTPAGDDALAGILLVEHLRRGAVPAEVVAAARTNDVARAFLAWAARGQSIEPVHRFLAAAADRDAVGARAAMARLLAFGHSSGADLALGLRLGLRATYCKPPLNPT